MFLHQINVILIPLLSSVVSEGNAAAELDERGEKSMTVKRGILNWKWTPFLLLIFLLIWRMLGFVPYSVFDINGFGGSSYFPMWCSPEHSKLKFDKDSKYKETRDAIVLSKGVFRVQVFLRLIFHLRSCVLVVIFPWPAYFWLCSLLAMHYTPLWV